MTQSEGPLRAARVARGWSQSRAAAELMSLAASRGIPVAAPLSLKTQLSRWENQHAVPDEHYRALLCELYGSTEVELGLAEATGRDELTDSDADTLRADLSASAELDDSAIELLRAQLRTARRLDRRLGTVAVIDTAQAQLSHLERALAHAVHPELRRELALLVTDAAALTGHLALDQARPSKAWRTFETAKMAAREADSPPLLSYVMVEQAFVLIEIGEHHCALSVVAQAAELLSGSAPSAMQAWLEAARGEALAMTGSAAEAHSAYQLAERWLTEQPPMQVDIRYAGFPFVEFDSNALHRHRGHARRVLNEQESAIEELEHALQVGAGSAREIAGVHIDLACAHKAVGDTNTAAQHARSGREIAARIGSTRLTAQLDAAGLRPSRTN
jgi:transcriptional regulator with XRE-family HTH domain